MNDFSLSAPRNAIHQQDLTFKILWNLYSTLKLSNWYSFESKDQNKQYTSPLIYWLSKNSYKISRGLDRKLNNLLPHKSREINKANAPKASVFQSINDCWSKRDRSIRLTLVRENMQQRLENSFNAPYNWRNSRWNEIQKQ